MAILKLGCIRSAENEDNLVVLVQNKNGFIDKEYVDLTNEEGISGEYYVFHTKNSKIKAYGFDNFIEAQDKYIKVAKEEPKKERKQWSFGKERFLIKGANK